MNFKSLMIVAVFTVMLFNKSVHAEPIDLSKVAQANSVSSAQMGETVMIRGVIKIVKESTGPEDPLLFYVADNQESKQVLIGYLPNHFQDFHRDLGTPKEKTQIMVRGKVWDYQGMLLVVPEKLEDVMIENYPHTYASIGSQPASQPTSNPVSAPVQKTFPTNANQEKIYSMDDFAMFESLLTKRVTFRGKSSDFTEPWSERAPNILSFTKDEDELEVVFWDKDNILDASIKQKGAEVIITGELQDYRDRLQLKVTDIKDVKEVKEPAQ